MAAVCPIWSDVVHCVCLTVAVHPGAGETVRGPPLGAPM